MTNHIRSTRLSCGSFPIAVALCVLLVLTACRLPRLGQATLPNDGPPVTTSQSAARRFVEKVTDAGLAGAEAGEATLIVTQEEVTSFLQVGAELAQQLQASGNLNSLEDLAELEDLDGLEGIEGLAEWQRILRRREGLPKISLPDLGLHLGIQEPEVHFRSDGQIVVRGYAQVRSVKQPVRVVVAPQLTDGGLAFDFVEGSLGPLGLPESLFDLIGKGLASAILAGQEVVQVTQVEVGDGTLAVSGRYRK